MKSILLSAVLSLAASLASAATFNFAAGSDDQHVVSAMEDGTEVRVFAYANYLSGEQGLVHRSGRGWGVSGGPDGSYMGGGEALVFDFAPKTQRLLSSIIFEKGAEAETVDLYIDGVYAETLEIPADGDSRTEGRWNTFDVSLKNYVGDMFAFVATSTSSSHYYNGHGVRVKGLSVAAVTAVPLPAGALLLMTGLGALALGKRRKA